jgi:mannose-6-phosphate isomerase-like protein (cupin superfamily)
MISSIQPCTNCFPSAVDEHRPLLFDMLPVPLNNVPFHNNTDAITRYFANGFPLHVAVHEVSPVLAPPETYTWPHVHEDCDEVNIIISQGDLLYRIQLGEEEFTVSNNSSIWIPRGMVHSANVLQGSGFFITIRLK